ncbi:dTMP kinase [Myxosarcina sp. GI1]|uniref:dTMP kinase n=1 Tax=Myxosarcina sp. GI1 TaxID=1541065 RepID=UPI00055DE8DC|nr:dTMP kinase [Myxosarcina sp. GI1]
MINRQSQSTNKKLFIVFEGIDSSGKSTQAELLLNYFINKEEKVIISSEPSNGIVGNIIRQALKQKIVFSRNRASFDEQMAYLFAADRHDHLYNDFDGVFKLIADGYHVISTRYYFSSLVYNCDTKEQFEFVSSLNARFPNPDLTIYLDLSVKESLNRLDKRSSKEIYETKEKLIKVRQSYQQIFSNYKGKFLSIDATKTPQNIHQRVIKYIENKRW